MRVNLQQNNIKYLDHEQKAKLRFFRNFQLFMIMLGKVRLSKGLFKECPSGLENARNEKSYCKKLKIKAIN